MNRIAVAALSLSAVAFGGLVLSEHYTDEAVIPVKGDRPTLGYGSTFHADGSPVRMGDRTNPVEAVQRSLAHIQKDEAGLKRCVTAPLHQAEYDLLVDAAYQYGAGTVCASSMVREANAGNYRLSCEAYLKYRFVAGRDCSKPGSGCRGVWIRAQARRDKCMAVQ
jgi:lysozyme